MKLEMDGKEPLLVIFGVPAFTAILVLAAIFIAGVVAPRAPESLQGTFTAEVTSVIPQGAVNVNIPPMPVPKVELREIAKSPPINIQVPEQRTATPNVYVTTPAPIVNVGSKDASPHAVKDISPLAAKGVSPDAPLKLKPTIQEITNEGSLLPPPSDTKLEAVQK